MSSCLPVLPPRVLVVAGPTASGKSALAVELALALDGEVVGADSRQVYRQLDVGTAKPTRAERDLVPHHLVDVVDPDEAWDAASWREAALAALADVHARGKLPIVCGGTGLYLRSLERGLFEGPPASPGLRAGLEAEEAARPGTLHARLGACDPASAGRLHPNDVVRLVRALEVFEVTGRPLSEWIADHALDERPFEVLVLEVDVPRDELAARILARSRVMVEQGIVEETADLLRRGYHAGLRSLDTIGYHEALACLRGEIRRADLAAAIAQATVRYAKRQRTWLRGQAEATKVGGGDAAAALSLARAFFS